MDVLALEVEGGLEHGTFAGHGYQLVVTAIEGRPDAPGVAHGEHLAAACEAAHHIASVVVAHRGAKDVGHLHVVVDMACDVDPLEPHLLGFHEEPLDLAVEAVTHKLEGEV